MLKTNTADSVMVPGSGNISLSHPPLIRLLQKAYSAEKAAAYAYQGHAGSLRKLSEKQQYDKLKKTNGITAGKYCIS